MNDVEIHIHDSQESYKKPDIIKEHYDEIIAAHDTSSTYNRHMIRVKDWSVKNRSFDITTERTTYYDSLVTNRAIDYKWNNGMSVRTLFEYGPFLNSLSKSLLSNHLGYNGFIESSDGHILFIKRNNAVSIGKGTYGNSVGASLKTEYALDSNKKFYAEGLKKAILKEIEKETSVKEEDLVPFTLEKNLICAYREFVEGGKPQLMFFAQSTLTKDEITQTFKKRKKEKAKTIFDKLAMDGKVWKWIKTSDLLSAELDVGTMKCCDKKYEMMPSAAACVAMLIQYLKTIHVDEKFLCGKENNPSTCEDGIYVGKHIVAVIDGVTAKGEHLWNGKSSGCYAKDILLNYFQENDLANYSAKELFTKLDQVLANAVKNEDAPLTTADYPRATVIVYNALYDEIWNYGDCQCRINDTVYTHRKEVDIINENLRAKVLLEHIEKGYSMDELRKNDPGRAAIQDNLMEQFQYENKNEKYGYPVLNGQGINPAFIKTYKLKPNTAFILASDGYPKVEKTLAESERELERLLWEDPLCIYEFKATKGLKEGNVSFDDRAYCRGCLATNE